MSKKSKFLALILRHQPQKIGIEMDRNGWVNVNDLCKLMPITKEDLDDIVENNNKNRFSYNDNKTKIRANQGHSIDVDVELSEAEPPEYLWHGTSQRYMDSIWKSGIKPMKRLYVHLSIDKETALSVGSRHGKPLALKIPALKLYNEGQKFFVSKNNVWLTTHISTRDFTVER